MTCVHSALITHREQSDFHDTRIRQIVSRKAVHSFNLHSILKYNSVQTVRGLNARMPKEGGSMTLEAQRLGGGGGQIQGYFFKGNAYWIIIKW